ncbi:hypothetical protein [Arthrobacter sp. NPDC056493]|uniref:hypothetical protein n=1 Tax=Arthrobacter sp. NPDC056493 TaxID=3345839 RepID=UPI00366F778C
MPDRIVPRIILSRLILPRAILAGIILSGIILAGRGLVPGTDAEVQHTGKAGVPVRHSGREESRATEGSEHDQAADKPGRRGGRT